MEETLSSLSPAGCRRWPEVQLPPRSGSMSLRQSVTTQFGWGFRTLQRGIETGDLRFHPRVIGVVGIWEDFLSRDWNSEFLGAAGP